MRNETINKETSSPINDEYIDLKQIYNALFRRRKLITRITSIGLLFSIIFSISRKHIWEGQFQIVLSENNNSTYNKLLIENPYIAQLIGSPETFNKLATEVEILKSPSILMPIFQFVKQERYGSALNKNKIRFNNWRKKSLKINLQKNTSVLNLSYRDSKKDLILPVLNKISKAYQLYSGKDRTRGIEKTIGYINSQISIYKDKSKESMKLAQKFAIRQDLPIQDLGEDSKLNIETSRFRAVNEIRLVEEQLKAIKSKEKNNELILILAKEIYKNEDSEFLKNIEKIEEEIILLKGSRTNKDPDLINALKKKKIYLEGLNKKVYEYLNAKKISLNSLFDSSFRTDDILIKYGELVRTASRDQKTLENLENERRILSLEQARRQDPWELITKPTLIDYPVAPHKKVLAAQGFLMSLIIACLLSLYLEKKKDLFYDPSEIKNIMRIPLLVDLSISSNEKNWEELVQIFVENILRKKGSGKVALIPIGQINIDLIEKFIKEISKYLSDQELFIANNLSEAKNSKTKLLIASLGITKNSELIEIQKKLSIYGVKDVYSIIL